MTRLDCTIGRPLPTTSSMVTIDRSLLMMSSMMRLDDPVMRSSRKRHQRRLVARRARGFSCCERRRDGAAERNASLQTMFSPDGGGTFGSCMMEEEEKTGIKGKRRHWSSKPDACCAVGVLPLLGFMMRPAIQDACPTSTSPDERNAPDLQYHENTWCGWINAAPHGCSFSAGEGCSFVVVPW